MNQKLAELPGSKCCDQQRKVQLRPITNSVPLGLIQGPELVNVFINDLKHRPECTWMGWSGWYTRWLCCHSEGPRQPGEMSQEKAYEMGRAEALHLGRNNSMHQHRRDANWLESSSAEMDSAKEMLDKLITSQRYALVAKTDSSLLACAR